MEDESDIDIYRENGVTD